MPAPSGPREQRARQLVLDTLYGRADYGKLDKGQQVEVYNWLVYNIQDPDTRQSMELPEPEAWEKQLNRVARRDAKTAAATAAANAGGEGGGMGKAFGRGLAESATFGLHRKFLPGLAAQLEGKPEGLGETVAEYAGHAAGFIPSMTIGAKVGVPLRTIQALRWLRWLAGLKKAGTAAKALHPVAERAAGEAGLGAFVGGARELAQAGIAGERPLTPGGVLKSAAVDAASFAPFGALRGRGQIGGTAAQIIRDVKTGQAVNVGGREVLPNLAKTLQGQKAAGYEALDPAVAAKIADILEGATTSVPRTGRPSGYIPIFKTQLPTELQGGKFRDIIRATRETPIEAIAEATARGGEGAVGDSSVAAIQSAAQSILHDWPQGPAGRWGRVSSGTQTGLPLTESVPMAGGLGLTVEAPMGPRRGPLPADLEFLLQRMQAPAPAVTRTRKAKAAPKSEIASGTAGEPEIIPREMITALQQRKAPPTPRRPGPVAPAPVSVSVPEGQEVPPTILAQAVESLSKQLGIPKEKITQAVELLQRRSEPAPRPASRPRPPRTPSAPAPEVPIETPRETLRPAGAETPGVPRRTPRPEVIGMVRMKPGPGYAKGMEYRVIEEHPNSFTVLYTGKRKGKKVYNAPSSIKRSKVEEYIPNVKKEQTPAGLATQSGSTAPAEFRVPKGTYKLTKPETDQRAAILTAYPEKTSVNPAGHMVTVFTEASASDLKQKFPLFDWEPVEGGVAGTLIRQYGKGAEKIRKGFSKRTARAATPMVGPKELRSHSEAPHEGQVLLAGDLVKVLHSRTRRPMPDEYVIEGFFYPPHSIHKSMKRRQGSAAEFVQVKNRRTDKSEGVQISMLKRLGGGATPQPKPGPEPTVTVGDI